MFEISAPYPGLETTTLLPNPQFSDTESLQDQVLPNRAVDGTLYTYVKRKGNRRKLQWTFQLTRNKGLELYAFALAYFASKVQITDHNNRVWVGNIINNPLEITSERRAVPAIQGWPRGETVSVQIEFEGVES